MEIKKSIETNITLNEGMKITLDICFRALHGCLGWIYHSTDTNTYDYHNSNDLGLLEEDLTLELLTIESFIQTKIGFILVFECDCDKLPYADLNECKNEILVCWSGGEE